MRAAGTTDTDADMVNRKIFPGKFTAGFVEGGRKHHVAMISIFIGIYIP